MFTWLKKVVGNVKTREGLGKIMMLVEPECLSDALTTEQLEL